MDASLFPGPASACGIDVSHSQGTINWNRVARAGMAFAFIKATQGIAEIDSAFHANWGGAKAAGLLRGAYHLYQPGMHSRQQAWHFLNIVQLDPGDLPPVLDVESNGNPGQIVPGIQEWLTTVEQATGRTPILYTDPSYWSTLGTANFGRFPLWIAEYGVTAPTVPDGWQTWTFWQFSDSGTVPGIQTPVDLDLFQGTLPDLQRMAQS